MLDTQDSEPSPPSDPNLSLDPKLLTPAKLQNTPLALRNQHEVVDHLHIGIGRVAPNLNFIPAHDGGKRAFDLHRGEMSPQARPRAFAEEQHLLLHQV